MLLTEQYDSRWDSYVHQQLSAYDSFFIRNNAANRRKPISIYLSDDNSVPTGALLGGILWNALFIQTLWVDEQYRRKGYGRQLLKRAIELAKENNCARLITTTTSFNTPEFYKAMGFEIAGELNDFPQQYSYYLLHKKI
jgi:ribosomal protein S18 acetylase RimI-like enzyme